MIESDTRYQRISGAIHDSASDPDFLLALETFIDVYKEEKVREDHFEFPVSVFSHRELGVLETIVKCLKENYSCSFIEIAHLISRDERTIWNAYNDAVHKHKEKFALRPGQFVVPLNIFSDRNLGPLESLAVYLRNELHIETKDIAGLLKRNYRTIWLSYQNGMKKKMRNAG